MHMLTIKVPVLALQADGMTQLQPCASTDLESDEVMLGPCVIKMAPHMKELATSGKPSTWLPLGRLVEQTLSETEHYVEKNRKP